VVGGWGAAPGTGEKVDEVDPVWAPAEEVADKLMNVKTIDKKKVAQMSWTVDPEGQFVDMEMRSQGPGWVAFALIDGPPVMVNPNAPHRVPFFPDKAGKVAYFKLETVFPSNFPYLEMDPSIEILAHESSDSSTRLRYRIYKGKGGIGDELLDLTSKNKVLWAHGIGAFPMIHDETGSFTIEWDKQVNEVTTARPPALTAPARKIPERSPTAVTAKEGLDLSNSVYVDSGKKVEIAFASDPDGSFVELEVKGTGQGWISIGLINGAEAMVAKPTHHVLLYPDKQNAVGYAELVSQDEDGVVFKPLDPSIEVMETENTPSQTRFRFRIHKGKGGRGDKILNIGGSNKLIWAQADGAYPEMHSSAGFTTVTWSSGVSTVSKDSVDQTDSIMMYLLLLPLLGIPFLIGPLRRSVVGTAILQKRVVKTPPKVPEYLGGVLGLHGIVDALSYKLGEYAMVLCYLGLHIALMLVVVSHGEATGKNIRRSWALATGFGSLGNVMMVLLPITKTSIWIYLLGIAYERAIKFHRILGRYTVLLLVAHLVLSLYRPISFEVDKLTDGVVTAFGLIAFIVFGVGAVAAVEIVRRRAFELFKWLHYIMWAGVIMTILHLPLVSTGWPAYAFVLMHLAVPVLLYAVDQVLRWFYSYLPASIETLKPLAEGASKLQVRAHPWASKWQEGSFYLINIPDISSAQWHPFSVCGDSTGQTLSFRIKDMGPGTFTHKLVELAQQVSSGHKPASEIKIHVEGPYGSLSIRPQDYRSLVLVGGGVGVTPLTSTIQKIKEQADNARLPKLETVELVWVVRTMEQLSWFEAYLCTFLKPNKDGPSAAEADEAGLEMTEVKEEDRPSKSPSSSPVSYRLRLFVTGAANEGVTEGGLAYSNGRPDLRDIIGASLEQYKGSHHDVGVVVCGPREMIVGVRNLSVEKTFDLHEEVFHW